RPRRAQACRRDGAHPRGDGAGAPPPPAAAGPFRSPGRRELLMPVVAVLANGAGATQALRRSLPVRSPWTVAACRTVAQLSTLFRGRLVDAVIISPAAMALPELAALRGGFPHVPWIAFAPFRPDDGQLLVRLAQGETRLVLVDGVDNAVAGDLVVRHSAAAARQRALRDAVRVLRLTEPLQRQVWEALLARVDQPVRTAEIAK